VSRIFLLSPAHCGGLRARLVMSERASFDLAQRVRARDGAPLGEVFSFLSGLYFRGKLTYARAFAQPPDVLVITPTDGLRPADEPVDLARLQRFATVDIAGDDPRYRGPLDRDARRGAPPPRAPGASAPRARWCCSAASPLRSTSIRCWPRSASACGFPPISSAAAT
jgi:hypothetical protein